MALIKNIRSGSLNEIDITGSLDVSGSGRFTDGLTSSGSITLSPITGVDQDSNKIIFNGIGNVAQQGQIYLDALGNAGGERLIVQSGVAFDGIVDIQASTLTVPPLIQCVSPSGLTVGIGSATNGFSFIQGQNQTSGYLFKVNNEYNSSSLVIHADSYNTVLGKALGSSDNGYTLQVLNTGASGSLFVSGSGRITNGLTVTGSINVLTGSVIINTSGSDISLRTGGNILRVYNNWGDGVWIGNGIDSSRMKLLAGPGQTSNIWFETNSAYAASIGTGTDAGVLFVNPTNRFQVLLNGDEKIRVVSGSTGARMIVNVTSSFDDNITNFQVSGSGRFTNGLVITGSLTVFTGSMEFQVLNTGTKIGNSSTDLHTITGSVGVQGSVAITNFLTASAALISGSGDSRLRVLGSGSVNPIMTVGGSSGQLLTVTDSLTGTLFAVNNISALPILSVESDSVVRIGVSNAMGLYTSYRDISTATNTEIYKVLTGSYDALYIDYTIRSGSNGRVGQFMSMWSGSQVNFTEVSASQFGDTSGFTLGAYISQSYMNISSSATTTGWDIKAIIRSI